MGLFIWSSPCCPGELYRGLEPRPHGVAEARADVFRHLSEPPAGEDEGRGYALRLGCALDLRPRVASARPERAHDDRIVEQLDAGDQPVDEAEEPQDRHRRQAPRRERRLAVEEHVHRATRKKRDRREEDPYRHAVYPEHASPAVSHLNPPSSAA